MIEKMTKYSFILFSKDTEGFIASLQELGVIDISRSGKPVDEVSTALFGQAEALKSVINAIEKDDFSKDEEYCEIAAALDSAQKDIDLRKPWGEFDDDAFTRLESQGIKTRFYRCSKKQFDNAWADNHALEIIHEDEGSVFFVIFSDKEGALDIPVKECTAPTASWQEASARADELTKKLAIRQEELKARKKDLPSLKKEYSDTVAALDAHLAKASAEKCSDNLLDVFIGFAPTSEDSNLKARFDSMDLFYISENASASDNPPIKLKNNWFTRQFEVLTGMYGMPLYDEFDPTPFLAPFFLLFFSMCMGDAGYGLLLIITAFILKNMQGGLARLWRLVLFLGIGTSVIGVVLGTFFGISLSEAAWVPQWMKNCMITGEIAGFNAQMVLAVAIGIFHICLAMFIKGIIFTKRFGFRETISTWGWVILIDGTLATIALSATGVFNASATKIAIAVTATLAVLGIFIFNKPGRNPLVNIGSGLWDTYGMVTGLAGDILSYIRLFALGLAGGMLGSAFNTLAGMTLGSDPTWQWLPFIIILIIGHALNFAMACLGAFVHPLRLNFLEFFKNCGYEGRGTIYKPINKNN